MATLSAISPFGPIFGKELRVTSRRRRTYALRFVYLGALLLFLLMVYLDSRSSYDYYGSAGGAARQQQLQAELGEKFFVLFSMFGIFAMALIGPVLTCTAISAEKLHKTLPVLLMTPITSWQIVSGKLFSRLLVALTLLGLSLPVLAVVRLLGGVEAAQMLSVLCLLVSMAMASAALGLLLSTMLTRAYAAILLSYAAMFVAYLLLPMFLVLMSSGSGPRMPVMMLICALNPFFCTGMEASGELQRLGGGLWVWCAGVHVALTAVLLVLSAVLVRRLARSAGEHAAAAAPAVSLLLPPVGGEASGIDQATPATVPATAPMPVVPARRRRREVDDNPVLWRELHRPLMAKRWQAGVGTVACVGLLLFTYVSLGTVPNALGDEELQIGFAFVFHTLLALLICVLAGTAIAQEKESDTWTLLLATPIRARDIVLGKFLGLLRRMLWPFMLVVLHFLLFTVTGVIPPDVFLLLLWVLATFNVVWLASGLYLSLRLGKSTFAVILNLALPLAAYLLPAILLSIASQLVMNRGDWSELVCWYLPYYYEAMIADRLSDASLSDVRMRMPTGFYAQSMEISGWEFVKITLMVGAGHIAVAGTILWHTIRRFDRLVGRSPQKQRLAAQAG